MSPTQDNPAASRLWWMVPFAGLLMLCLLGLVIGPPPPAGGTGNSYDASDVGFRALFLLLDELGYPVERSRRATSDTVRWVLLPVETREQEISRLDDWVRRGGIVLLALNGEEFARHLGMRLRIRRADAVDSAPCTVPDVGRLALGRTVVEWPNQVGRVWAKAGGEPLVTIYAHGNGEVWLLHRPDVFLNEYLRRADNGVLACRLAEAMLEGQSGKLAIDEYYHGLHERPGVLELLFQPPLTGFTVMSLVLTALLLWRFVPRFGALRVVPPTRRRSKEEFLDAMASLLERKGDYADAFRTVQRDLRHRLEADLGLPAGTPVEETVREAARRRGLEAETLLRLLTAREPPGGHGPAAFLNALHQLESTRDALSRRNQLHR
jgi:hypothetical protein